MAIGVNWAEIWAPVWGPVWTQTPPEPPAPRRETGAGRSRPQKRRRFTVVVDGEEFSVDSPAEAEAVLVKAREVAQELADVAVQRASKAQKRPLTKVLKDARNTLKTPQISAPDFSAMAQQILGEIASLYRSTLQDIEVAALMRRAEEQDDEDVLLLL